MHALEITFTSLDPEFLSELKWLAERADEEGEEVAIQLGRLTTDDEPPRLGFTRIAGSGRLVGYLLDSTFIKAVVTSRCGWPEASVRFHAVDERLWQALLELARKNPGNGIEFEAGRLALEEGKFLYRDVEVEAHGDALEELARLLNDHISAVI